MFDENTVPHKTQTLEEKINRLKREQSVYRAIRKLQVEIAKLEKRIVQKEEKLGKLTNTIADTF